MNTNEHMIIIIAKKLHDEATKEELAELGAWLDADIANREEYKKLEQIWAETREIFSGADFNINAAWNKVDTAINSAPENKSKKTPLIPVFYLFSAKRIVVAAAAVILIIVGLYFYTSDNSTWKTITADKENLQVMLPDNSKVLLRKGTTLGYPENFDKDIRSVDLSGEAFFEVHRNEQQPFVISTANSKVKVLGTTFLVRSKEKRDEVVVVTGKVSVSDKEKEANQVMLMAGQKTVFLNKVFQQSQVKDSNFISWKNGVLVFKNDPLAKALEDISNYYEMPVDISAPDRAEIEKIQVNIRIEKQSFEQVIEEIKLITGLEAKKENGKTIIFQK
jgi:transmembrane sensor